MINSRDIEIAIAKIYRTADEQEADLLGFYGDFDTPVVVDWETISPIVMFRINHAHDLNGKCKKNRFGPHCED